MIDFGGKTWFEEIAETSTQEEYQTAEIELWDPTQVTGGYDVETGEDTTERVGDPIYRGRARVIALRRGVNYEGATQHNSKTLTGIRVQIPHKAADFRVVRSTVAIVTSSPWNHTLESYQYTLSSDFHGSSAAARTFEFNLDGDSTHG